MHDDEPREWLQIEIQGSRSLIEVNTIMFTGVMRAALLKPCSTRPLRIAVTLTDGKDVGLLEAKNESQRILRK